MTQTDHTQNGNGIDFEGAFSKLVLEASLASADNPNDVVEVLRNHLGFDPIDAAQAVERFEHEFRLMPLQGALDKFLSQNGRSHDLVGVASPIGNPRFELTLAHMFTPESLQWPGTTLGVPMWEQQQSGYDRWMRCLYQGLLLVRDADGPFAIWIATTWPNPSWEIRHVTIIAADPMRVNAVLDEIKRLMPESSPYIGEMFRPRFDACPDYMRRPARMTADDVIMPPGLLERIDQHAIGITLGAERIADAGLHLKRGLLLYGPPGTGKTHTLRYLASRLPEHSTIMVVDPMQSLGMVAPYLEYVGSSAMVLLDDIDSIASARSLPGRREDLFELLEILDGLRGHGDVLFVLTTNRLDALEPAVAARPGRIDEALEVPRPDADCRRRLFHRYAEGMDLRMDDAEVDEVVERTHGVTGSFTKELFRRSTIVAVARGAGAGSDGRVPVTGADVFQALDEMLDPENPATRLLLGADPEHTSHKVIVTMGDAK